jgi:hypothetical protein
MGTVGIKFRRLVAAIVYLAIVSTARPVLITNAAGVKAGITGIVYHSATNSIGVDFIVIDPTGTNVTKFTIQTNATLKTTWTDYSATQTVTGSFGPAEISDFATSSNKFYRMRLINFQ